MFVFAFAVLLLEMWVLGKIPQTGSKISVKKQMVPKPAQTGEHLTGLNEAFPKPNAHKSLLAFVGPPQFIVAILLFRIYAGLFSGHKFSRKNSDY